MKKSLITLFILFIPITTFAIKKDSTLTTRTSFFKNMANAAYTFVKNFSLVDTMYIEPQKYNFTAMLQNTNTYEVYSISTQNNMQVKFSPEPTIKIGPYMGWRWIFLGYTVDVTHINDRDNRKEFDLSLYSSQIGIDLFYRKTGNGYKIKEMELGDIDTSPILNVGFNGLTSSIKGFNVYYIFNHKRFSYPAAFSQSTIQRKSYGSPLIGIGYTKHSLEVDWNKMHNVIEDKFGKIIADEYADSNLVTKKIEYTDYSISGGYAYNWVFAHNWLFAASLSAAIGYNHTIGDDRHAHFSFRDFSLRNFNIDGVGRFGVVWNNMKWYAGASTILHSYNYNKKQFSTNNFFGSLNIYFGFNFIRRKY